MALAQGQKDVQNILYWINTSVAMGPEAASAIDMAAAARHLGASLGVPSDLIRTTTPDLSTLTQTLNETIEGDLNNEQ
jgi:hypothetical protein